jgi:hypothetical protein
MNDQSHFEKFLSKKNFILAYERIKNSPKSSYKELYYSDINAFGFFLDTNIETLIDLIETKIYSPEKPYKVFIPKRDNLIRPITYLKFTDYLVYQAVINVISDTTYDVLNPYYNYTLFGNLYNTSKSKDSKFFYKKWKEQWRRFEDKTKEHFSFGYEYLADFDIASFYDSIDHQILEQILINRFSIDKELVEFLNHCLSAWTVDFHRGNFYSKRGIPQGPLSSPILADLYLFILDSNVLDHNIDIKYLRYVDDIRVFAKNEITARRAIAFIDLITRDLGLIPQSGKLKVKKITNIEQEIISFNKEFSSINSEFKAKGKILKSKTHRKLLNKFLGYFDRESDYYQDKTLFNFALYKLNEDLKIKETLLLNIEDLFHLIEPVFYYLSTHFSNDSEVLDRLALFLEDENILFHYINALIFKYFSNIYFKHSIYQRYVKEHKNNWFVQYYMLDWIQENNKKDIIRLFESQNYFVKIKESKLKSNLMEDKYVREDFLNTSLSDDDALIALHAHYELFHRLYSIRSNQSHNIFVKAIVFNDKPDLITYLLSKEFKILYPESFFKRSVWKREGYFTELCLSFYIFVRYKNIDPSKSLMNLNIFNELIFDSICDDLSIAKPHKDYGVNLEAKLISDQLPKTNIVFNDINKIRNERSEAHPYDKLGNIRIRISAKEHNIQVNRELDALKEICSYYNNLGLSF